MWRLILTVSLVGSIAAHATPSIGTRTTRATPEISLRLPANTVRAEVELLGNVSSEHRSVFHIADESEVRLSVVLIEPHWKMKSNVASQLKLDLKKRFKLSSAKLVKTSVLDSYTATVVPRSKSQQPELIAVSYVMSPTERVLVIAYYLDPAGRPALRDWLELAGRITGSSVARKGETARVPLRLGTNDSAPTIVLPEDWDSEYIAEKDRFGFAFRRVARAGQQAIGCDIFANVDQSSEPEAADAGVSDAKSTIGGHEVAWTDVTIAGAEGLESTVPQLLSNLRTVVRCTYVTAKDRQNVLDLLQTISYPK